MNKQTWMQKMRDPATKMPMPLMSFPCVQKLGITVRQLVTDSQMQADGICKIAELFPSSAAVTMMDLSVEAEAFGSPVLFSDKEVPTVTGAIVTDMEEAEALQIPSVDNGRCRIYSEAVRLVKERLHDRPLFAGVIGPFSLAGRLLDMTEIMVACYTEPEMVECVLEKASAFITNYIELLKEAGADGVVMAEPAAGLLSPEFNRDFSIPYVKKIFDAVKQDDFMILYHNCGNVIPLADDIFSLGADGYHFGNAIDLTAMAEKCPNDAFVMGNIDPVGIFCRATPEETYETTMALLEKLGDKENFLLSSGCDIPAHASFANAEAFYQASAAYYKK